MNTEQQIKDEAEKLFREGKISNSVDYIAGRTKTIEEKDDEITQLKSALSKAQSKITELLIKNDKLKRK